MPEELWRKEFINKVDEKTDDCQKLYKIVTTARRVFFEVEGGQVGDEYSQKVTCSKIESGLHEVHSRTFAGSNHCTPFKYRASVIIAIPRNLGSTAEYFGGTEYGNQENAPKGKVFFIFELPDNVLKEGHNIHRTF